MPGISGKQLAGDLINLVFGSFRSQIKAGTLTANRSITLPNDSGTVLLDDRPIGSLNAGVSVRGYLPIVTVAASKTLALSDSNTTQLCSAVSTITIPLNSAVAFPIGTEITILRNTSVTVTLALAAGVTAVDRLGATNTSTTVQSHMLLKKIGTDSWMVAVPIPSNAFIPGDPTCVTQSPGTTNLRIANTLYVANAIGIMPSLAIVAVSTSKTLALTDASTSQLCSAASTITIPLNSAVAFLIGTEIVIQRNTSAAVILAVTAGVTTLNEFGGANTLTAVSNFTRIKKTATDTWIVSNPIPDSALLPGNPTTTTQPAGTNNTTIATTAHVAAAITVSNSTDTAIGTALRTASSAAAARQSIGAVDATYVQARPNLVNNGYPTTPAVADGGGVLRGYNFSKAIAYPVDSGGGLYSYRTNIPWDTVLCDEYVPVTPGRIYGMTLSVQSLLWVSNQAFFGIIENYDIDKNLIVLGEHTQYPLGSRTKLTRPLNVGDTLIYLDRYRSGVEVTWTPISSTYDKWISIYPYTSAGGYVYPTPENCVSRGFATAYSRLKTQYSNISISASEIILTISAWNFPNPQSGSGGTWPIGAEVANTKDGGYYTNAYPVTANINNGRFVDYFPSSATANSGTFTSSLNTSATNSAKLFPFAAFFRAGIWANFNGVGQTLFNLDVRTM